MNLTDRTFSFLLSLSRTLRVNYSECRAHQQQVRGARRLTKSRDFVCRRGLPGKRDFLWPEKNRSTRSMGAINLLSLLLPLVVDGLVRGERQKKKTLPVSVCEWNQLKKEINFSSFILSRRTGRPLTICCLSDRSLESARLVLATNRTKANVISFNKAKDDSSSNHCRLIDLLERRGERSEQLAQLVDPGECEICSLT